MSRPARRDVLVIGLVAAAVRATYIFSVVGDDELIGDARRHEWSGGQLAQGLGYIRAADYEYVGDVTPTAEYPPVWPMVLALFDLLGLDTPFQQRFAGCVLGLFMVVVTMGLSRAVTAGVGRSDLTRPVGVVAGVLVAFSPVLAPFDVSLLSEPLYAVLVTGFVWSGLVAWSEPRARNLLVAGILVALAAMTRTEAAVLLFVVGLPVTRHHDTTTWLKRFVLICLPVLVVFGAWTVRNAVQVGSPVVLTGNSGTVLAGSHCDSVYDGRRVGLWDFNCVTSVSVPADEVGAAAVYRETGLRYARAHLGEQPRLATIRILRSFGLYRPSTQKDYEAGEGRPRSWVTTAHAFDLAVLPIAAIGTVWLARRRRHLVALLLSPLGVALVVIATTFGSSRFRMGFEPTHHLLTAIGLVVALEWLRSHRKSRQGDSEGRPRGPDARTTLQ